MISMLASNAIDCEFKPWSGQTKDNKIGICCFSDIKELEQRLAQKTNLDKLSYFSNKFFHNFVDSELFKMATTVTVFTVTHLPEAPDK
jgi:hypothetical protein